MFRLAVLLVVLSEALGAPLISPDGRIINGRNTTIELHPYQLSVQHNNTHFCGAILIAPTWALTAAHCATVYHDKNLTIRAGSTNRSSGGQLVAVSKIILNDNWNYSKSFDNNIAIFQLAAPVTIATAGIGTLPVAGAAIPTGAIATITGWGETKEYNFNIDYGTDILQEIQSPILSDDECISAVSDLVTINNTFCAGLMELNQKISCYRDMGGPAVVNNTVVGMTSLPLGFFDTRFPGLYVKIANYRSWITQISGV